MKIEQGIFYYQSATFLRFSRHLTNWGIDTEGICMCKASELSSAAQ